MSSVSIASAAPAGVRVIPLKSLPEKGIRYCRRQIYNLVNAGQFPRPIWLSARRRAWLESDLDTWLLSRPMTQPESGRPAPAKSPEPRKVRGGARVQRGRAGATAAR